MGGSYRCSSSMKTFADTINQCGLMDIKFYGPKFTWKNNQLQSNEIQERLDRLFANVSWNSMFKDARVTHHDFYRSDHRILTVDLHSPAPFSHGSAFGKPFRFEPFWQSESSFPLVMNNIWSEGNYKSSLCHDLVQRLEECGKSL